MIASSTPRAVMRGLMALLGLAAVVAGGPAVLWAAGGSPLPGEWPSWAEVHAAAVRPDDGTLFLALLIVTGWLGWGTFVLSLLVEVLATLRGRPAPRLPGLGAQQRLVAGLVAAVAAVGAGGQAASAGSTSPEPWEPAPPVTTDLLDAQQRGGTHVVVDGDTLWEIAGARLDNPLRYPEIVEASSATVQPDGRRLTDPDLIVPGWTLTLPESGAAAGDLPDTGGPPAGGVGPEPGTDDTATNSGTETSAPSGAGTGCVRSGSEELGPGDEVRSGDVDVADVGRADVGRAGVGEVGLGRADLDGVGLGAPEPGSAHLGHASRGDAIRGGAERGDAYPVLADALEPDAAEPAQPAEPGQPEVPGEPAQPDQLAERGKSGEPEEPGELVRTVSGVGAVLAAALVGVLATRRAREQRRRRPGERLGAGSETDQRTETELRQAADPVAVEVVDRVLRGLATWLARAGRGLPPLRAVRLTRRTLELYLAAPAELPPPFAGTAHGGVWTVPLDQAMHDDAEVPAPYPSLVTLGHDHDDALVLLDLEQVGTLVVDGPPELVRSALTAVAAELATSAWADDLRVTLVGAPALADFDLLDTGRVRHVTDVEQLLDELTVRVADDRLLLATAGVSGLGAARVTQVADAAWTPEIVVIAEPLPTGQWDRLEALTVTAPRVAVAAVVGSGEPNGLPSRGHRLRGWEPHAGGATWVLRLDGSAERPVAILDPLGIPVRPQLLDEETRIRFLRLLGAVAGPEAADVAAVASAGSAARANGLPRARGEVPVHRAAMRGEPATTGTAQRLVAGPTRSTTEPDRVGSSGPAAAEVPEPGHELPRLMMLGAVEVGNAAELGEQSKLGQLTELAMFIALNPGCDSTAIDEAIWPGSAVTKTTRGTAISKLRRWLGTDAAGSSLLPRSDSGYTLRPGVRSDWDDWRDLLADGPARASVTELRAAIELVRGRPFSGRGRRRYTWADHLAQEMIASIVDACHELALRSLVDHDPWEALRAALLGLSIEPGVELLWRDRLKAEAELGDRDGLLDSIEKLRAVAAEIGGGLEAETEELIDRLRSGRGAQAEAGSHRGTGGQLGASEVPGRAPIQRPGQRGPGRPRSPAGR